MWSLGSGAADICRSTAFAGEFVWVEEEVVRVEKEVVYTDPEEWWQSLWTHCPRGILERMRKSTLGGVKDCLQRRAGALTPNGKILAEFRAYLAVGRKG